MNRLRLGLATCPSSHRKSQPTGSPGPQTPEPALHSHSVLLGRALPATGQLKDPQTPEPALHSHTVLLGHVLPAVPSLPCCGPAERPSDLRACAHHSHTVLLGRALPACLPCHALPACPPCRAAGQPKGSQTGAHWPVIWVLVSNVSNHPSDLSLVS